VWQYVTDVSVAGMRLDANQLSTICLRLSSLTQLRSLRLSNNIVDLTSDKDSDGIGLRALQALLSALPALRRLDLSDVCLTGRLGDILTSIGSVQPVFLLELSRHWLNRHDLAALHRFQQQKNVVIQWRN